MPNFICRIWIYYDGVKQPVKQIRLDKKDAGELLDRAN